MLRPGLSAKGSPGMAKEIFVSFGIDVDAVAGWLGSYGGEDSPCDISRGLFAGEVGSPVQEEAIFDKCIEVIEKLCGKKPR